MNLPVNYNNLDWRQRRDVRNLYVTLQNGNCQHCGAPLHEDAAKHIKDAWVNEKLFPPNFFKFPVHLHHSHKTGMTIGAVHNKCNAVLWQYHGE